MRVNDLAARLRARYEVNHNLQVQVLLCNGEQPFYALPSYKQSCNLLESLQGKSNAPSLFQDLLGIEIVIKYGADRNRDHVVFRAEEKFDRIALENEKGDSQQRQIRFICSEDALPPPPREGRYSFYGRFPNDPGTEFRCATIEPLKTEEFDFEVNVHAVLDEEGWLHLIIGEEPDMYTTNDPQKLIDCPGCVYSYEMELSHRGKDPYLDPFSGVH
jgi:hypothetical protein